MIRHVAIVLVALSAPGLLPAQARRPARTTARPATRLPPTVWSTVAAGSGYTCALDNTGQAFCWGENLNQKLGVTDSVNRWTAKMEVLEGQLEKTKRFVTGDAFTIADVALALSVHRWFMTPLQHKGFPEVARYYERMKDRKAGKAWLTKETP